MAGMRALDTDRKAQPLTVVQRTAALQFALNNREEKHTKNGKVYYSWKERTPLV